MKIADIPVAQIHPSPYQNRKHFGQDALDQLAQSIRRDGLVEPIVIRPNASGYELIAGERRWRAMRTFSDTILARIVEVDDLTARRMCAAENMQRADLSAVEEIACLVEVVDAELSEDIEYLALGDEPIKRVKKLLVAMDGDWKHKTQKVGHKFVSEVERVFSGLPKPKDWRSFFVHDLSLVTSIAPEVLDTAIENRLNKSQTKALSEISKTAPAVYAELLDSATDDGAITVKDEQGEDLPLHELSARDIARVGLFGVDSISKRAAVIETLNTGDMEGYTPSEYVECAREVMGGIDVDPASNALAQEVVRARVYYTAADSGLEQEWRGSVFLNPPYNAGVIDQFLDKLILEFDSGNTKQAVVLTNNNTDTGWFHKTAAKASAICLTRGRIHFYKPDRSTVSPTNGQAFFYFGEHREEFVRVFAKIGLVLVKA